MNDLETSISTPTEISISKKKSFLNTQNYLFETPIFSRYKKYAKVSTFPYQNYMTEMTAYSCQKEKQDTRKRKTQQRYLLPPFGKTHNNKTRPQIIELSDESTE